MRYVYNNKMMLKKRKYFEMKINQSLTIFKNNIYSNQIKGR